MKDPLPAGDPSFNSSLARGLSVLGAFDSSSPRLGITELARKTGLSKSTVFRLVHTLRSLGYLTASSDEPKYGLGPKVLTLGFAVLSGLELREVAQPYLQQLSQKVEETVNLAVRDGWQLIYIERIKTQNIININLHVGSRLELYNTALGRVLAAFEDSEWLSGYLQYLRKLPEAKPYWNDSGEKLLEILKTVRTRDLAVNDEELTPGLRSVAAPVRDRSGKVVGAVNVAVSSSLYSLKKIEAELFAPLRQTAAEISAALGYLGSEECR